MEMLHLAPKTNSWYVQMFRFSDNNERRMDFFYLVECKEPCQTWSKVFTFTRGCWGLRPDSRRPSWGSAEVACCNATRLNPPKEEKKSSQGKWSLGEGEECPSPSYCHCLNLVGDMSPVGREVETGLRGSR